MVTTAPQCLSLENSGSHSLTVTVCYQRTVVAIAPQLQRETETERQNLLPENDGSHSPTVTQRDREGETEFCYQRTVVAIAPQLHLVLPENSESHSPIVTVFVTRINW